MRAPTAALLLVACGGSQTPSAPRRATPAITVPAPASAAPAAKQRATTATEGRWEWTQEGLLWIGGSTISLWQLDPLRLVVQRSASHEVVCANVSASLNLLMATTSTKTRVLWDLASSAPPTPMPEKDNPLVGCLGSWFPASVWVDQYGPALRLVDGRMETIAECAASDCFGTSPDGSWFHVIDEAGIRLKRSDGRNEQRLGGAHGFWSSAGAFVEASNPSATTYWDPQSGRRLWAKRGVRAESVSPEGDRLLVLHGRGDGCEGGTWSVLSSRDGHSIATFKYDDGNCCPEFAWAPHARGQSTLVFSDGFRIRTVDPDARVDSYTLDEHCTGDVRVGRSKLTVGNVVFDLATRSMTKLDELTGDSQLSPSDDYVGGSRLQGFTIWDARTGAVVAAERGLSSGSLRWVSPSALLFSPPDVAWTCLLSGVDPRQLCLTVVQREGERLVLALADDGTYSLAVDWSTMTERLRFLDGFARPQRLCPDLLTSYLRGEHCVPS